jgi:hypothetical protein
LNVEQTTVRTTKSEINSETFFAFSLSLNVSMLKAILDQNIFGGREDIFFAFSNHFQFQQQK